MTGPLEGANRIRAVQYNLNDVIMLKMEPSASAKFKQMVSGLTPYTREGAFAELITTAGIRLDVKVKRPLAVKYPVMADETAKKILDAIPEESLKDIRIKKPSEIPVILNRLVKVEIRVFMLGAKDRYNLDSKLFVPRHKKHLPKSVENRIFKEARGMLVIANQEDVLACDRIMMTKIQRLSEIYSAADLTLPDLKSPHESDDKKAWA